MMHILLSFVDPPEEVNINTPGFMENTITLEENFEEFVLNASAKSYPGITCRNVKIIWTSSKHGVVKSCEAEGT